MAYVVQEARQQLRGEWSEWSAPVWRRPSHGPGSRSQSADPPLSALSAVPLHLPSVSRGASRAGSEGHPPKPEPEHRENTERAEPAEPAEPAGRLSKCSGRLLKPRSCSVSSERSWGSELEVKREDGWGSSSDEVDDELQRIEQELQDKQRELEKVRGDGSALEERLEMSERNARHFGEFAALLEAGLQDADREEGAPHRELRPPPRPAAAAAAAADPGRTQAIDELVDEWSRARAALGLV
ncbi:unnamed protein product [Symbiodinium natans]|uniref:Uncharacterized protein n=1 Tax=Symbiodinium natans TaxID=878477 RepID=A0A812TTH9_9DINO|nr:unnamed protein product [Symbiodinium natans]